MLYPKATLAPKSRNSKFENHSTASFGHNTVASQLSSKSTVHKVAGTKSALGVFERQAKAYSPIGARMHLIQTKMSAHLAKPNSRSKSNSGRKLSQSRITKPTIVNASNAQDTKASTEKASFPGQSSSKENKVVHSRPLTIQAAIARTQPSLKVQQETSRNVKTISLSSTAPLQANLTYRSTVATEIKKTSPTPKDHHTLNSYLLHKTRILTQPQLKTKTSKLQNQFIPATKSNSYGNYVQMSPKAKAKVSSPKPISDHSFRRQLNEISDIGNEVLRVANAYQTTRNSPSPKEAAKKIIIGTPLTLKAKYQNPRKSPVQRRLLFEINPQPPIQAVQKTIQIDSASPPSRNSPIAQASPQRSSGTYLSYNTRTLLNPVINQSPLTQKSRNSLQRNVVVQKKQLLPVSSKRQKWSIEPSNQDKPEPIKVPQIDLLQLNNSYERCPPSPGVVSQSSENLRYEKNSTQKHKRIYSTYQDDEEWKVRDKTPSEGEKKSKNQGKNFKQTVQVLHKRSIIDESEARGPEFQSQANDISPVKTIKETSVRQRQSRLPTSQKQLHSPKVRESCEKALKLILEIESRSKKDEELNKLQTENHEDSEDSNDSLIQTQRKLKKEYHEVRLSQSRENSQIMPLLTLPQESVDQKITLVPYGQRSQTPISSKRLNKLNKILSHSSQKKYVKQTVIQLESAKRNSETKSEKGSDKKFPLDKFLSASSDFEENDIIERFSMQVRSSQNFSNSINQDTNKSKAQKNMSKQSNELHYTKIGRGPFEEYGRPINTESQAVQNTINSLQSLNSLKPLMNDSVALRGETDHQQKTSEFSGIIERISIHDEQLNQAKRSIINVKESESSPFKANNRSPDSFVRISLADKNEQVPAYTRVSLLSMVTHSQKTSHISQKSSVCVPESDNRPNLKADPVVQTMQITPTKPKVIRTTPRERKNEPASLKDEKTPKANNIEINIEKIIQILELLENMIQSQSNLIILRDRRETFAQNKQFQSKFERINEDRLQSTINLCEEWWNIIREPTVSLQLNKSIKILSHVKIQHGLNRALIYQLLYFSISGFFYSQEQYQFSEILAEIAYYSHLNFSVLCQILVEKFPEQVIEKNAWANKLTIQLGKNKTMSTQLARISETLLHQSQNLSQRSSANLKDFSVMSQGSAASQKTHLMREAKYQYLKMNNKMNHDLFTKLLHQLDTDRDFDKVFKNPMVSQVKQMVLSINTENLSLLSCIDNIGKALREDYNEEQTSIEADLEKVQLELSQHLRVQIDNGIKLIPPPYLKTQNTKEYTLVLDLDETLLHFEELNENEGQLSIRPGADSFLKLMKDYFEIVIFTAGTEEYADWALSFMENSGLIDARFYRQHALPFNGFYIKDLSRLGRDLRKTIIVDNIAENFQLQPYNGIFIKTWIDESNDTCLFTLAPLLMKIVKTQIKDVRDFIKELHESGDRVLQSIAYGSSSEQQPKMERVDLCDVNLDEDKENQVQHTRRAPRISAIDELTSEEEKSQDNNNENDFMAHLEFGLTIQPPQNFLKYQEDQEKQSLELTPSYFNSDFTGNKKNPTCYTILESMNEVGSSVDLSQNHTIAKVLQTSNKQDPSHRMANSLQASKVTPFQQSVDSPNLRLKKSTKQIPSKIHVASIKLFDNDDEAGPISKKNNYSY